MISWYDEQFNKRDREATDKLPDLRKWDGHKLAWAPEKSDYPMQGTGVLFLHNTMQLGVSNIEGTEKKCRLNLVG